MLYKCNVDDEPWLLSTAIYLLLTILWSSKEKLKTHFNISNHVSTIVSVSISGLWIQVEQPSLPERTKDFYFYEWFFNV